MKSKSTRKLFLDDLRIPPDDTWEVVRNYQEFIYWIETNGLPGIISFDHDLGEDKSGFDGIKWLCEFILNENEKRNQSKESELEKQDLPQIRVHSANPVGKENIELYWKSFMRSYQENVMG